MMKSRHVPLFLYYWRAAPTSCVASLDTKPAIPRRRMAMLDDLVAQAHPGLDYVLGSPIEERGECHLSIKLTSHSLGRTPRLLILVWCHTDPALLIKTLESLESQTHSLDIRVVLARPEPGDPELDDVLGDWLERERSLRYEVLDVDRGSTFAQAVNRAVSKFGPRMDLVLSLSSDIELQSPEAIQTLAMQLLADPGSGLVGLRLVDPDGRSIRHAGLRMFEHVEGSGYHAIEPIRDPQFVHDEHLVLGLSLSCAMFRRETFDEIGGLDEMIASDNHLDFDFSAKAIARGLRNYYFGTLAAIEHGPDRRLSAGSHEFERAMLHERHARILASWRMRMFAHRGVPIWPTHRPPVEVTAELPPKPARYKVADGVNSGLKLLLGPVHGVVKAAVMRSWNIARKLRRRPGGAPTPHASIYRPTHTQDHSRPSNSPR